VKRSNGKVADAIRSVLPSQVQTAFFVPLAGQIGGLRAATFDQNEGSEKALVGRAPGTDELLCARREGPCRRASSTEVSGVSISRPQLKKADFTCAR
jgi:hypothetical protein